MPQLKYTLKKDKADQFFEKILKMSMSQCS